MVSGDNLQQSNHVTYFNAFYQVHSLPPHLSTFDAPPSPLPTSAPIITITITSHAIFNRRWNFRTSRVEFQAGKKVYQSFRPKRRVWIFNSHHYWILINSFITSKKPLLHPIWLKCRQIGPVISPFLNIFQVFYIGSGAVERVEKEDCDEEYIFFLSFLLILFSLLHLERKKSIGSHTRKLWHFIHIFQGLSMPVPIIQTLWTI